jgi:hypothetical protein
VARPRRCAAPWLRGSAPRDPNQTPMQEAPDNDFVPQPRYKTAPCAVDGPRPNL